MQDSTLVLRDIHQGVAPAWWPPAPGWWLLALAVVVGVAVLVLVHRRRRERERRITRMFDEAIEAASDSPAQIAAMSELLRRAARRRDPGADRLHGESWLAFLDAGDPRQPFTRGAGRVLLEGGYRRDADAQAVAQLRPIARERFTGWMAK